MQLLALDWTVIGLARRPAPFDDRGYLHVSIDLSVAESLQRDLAPQLEAILMGLPTPSIFALVNNAGANPALGPIAQLGAAELAATYQINTVAPTWLMGFVSRSCPQDIPLRIVNLTSGAATRPFPGMAAYCGTKAALRITGATLAAELEGQRNNLAVLNFSPGGVATEMTASVSAQPRERFPWVDDFNALAGDMAAPEDPAREIVEFLEGDDARGYSESRHRETGDLDREL